MLKTWRLAQLVTLVTSTVHSSVELMTYIDWVYANLSRADSMEVLTHSSSCPSAVCMSSCSSRCWPSLGRPCCWLLPASPASPCGGCSCRRTRKRLLQALRTKVQVGYAVRVPPKHASCRLLVLSLLTMLHRSRCALALCHCSSCQRITRTWSKRVHRFGSAPQAAAQRAIASRKAPAGRRRRRHAATPSSACCRRPGRRPAGSPGSPPAALPAPPVPPQIAANTRVMTSASRATPAGIKVSFRVGLGGVRQVIRARQGAELQT